MSTRNFPRLPISLVQSTALVWLFAGLQATGCDVEATVCSEDPDPIQFCSDLLGDGMSATRPWACTATPCGELEPNDHGCVPLADLLREDIAQDNACIHAWPEMDPSGTEGGGTTGKIPPGGTWNGDNSGVGMTSTTGVDLTGTGNLPSSDAGSSSGSSTAGSTGSSNTSTGGDHATTSTDTTDTASSSDTSETSSTDESTTSDTGQEGETIGESEEESGPGTSGDDDTSGDEGSENESGGTEDDTSETGVVDPCEDRVCHNGGTCEAGECLCRPNYDPTDDCQSCLPGFVAFEDRCVADRCANNPCHIGSDGHGESCSMVSASEYSCECLGDFTTESHCSQCPEGQEPDHGHDCKATDLCENVSCGSGAICDGENGQCKCMRDDVWMDGSGDCRNPCDDDPCNIKNGHGQNCTATELDSYNCGCNGGHTPESHCEACPEGKVSHEGQCLDKCKDDCEPGEYECVSGSTVAQCVQRGRCPRWEEEDCGNGRCDYETGECGPPPGMAFVEGGPIKDRLGQVRNLADFFIDIHEVSMADYETCVETGACQAVEDLWTCNFADDSRRDHPANCVRWEDANAYCRWLGKKLPVAMQFQWVMQNGARESRYPWGNNEPTCELAAVGNAPDCGASIHTKPVGSHPEGVNFHGIHDLVGNVAEWMDDWSAGDVRYIKGGSRSENEDPSVQTAAAEEPRAGSTFSPWIGFRCSLVK